MVTAPGSIIVASTRANSAPRPRKRKYEKPHATIALEIVTVIAASTVTIDGVHQPQPERRLLPDLHVVVERERLGDEPVVEHLAPRLERGADQPDERVDEHHAEQCQGDPGEYPSDRVRRPRPPARELLDLGRRSSRSAPSERGFAPGRRGGDPARGNRSTSTPVIAVPLVVDEPSRDDQLDRRDDHDDQEQQPRHRRGVAHVQEPERLLEQVDDVEQRGVVAVGRVAGAEEGRVRLVERLESRDRVHDDDEEQRRADHRHVTLNEVRQNPAPSSRADS